MRMPVLFVGHGSPMNAIEDNEFTREWSRIGRQIRPKAILMVSAHWFTKGSFTQTDENPEVINDMYGFPDELYRLNYRVKGSAELGQKVVSAVHRPVEIRDNWGIDHGAWSVLVHMYPDRDIPVVQLSVDASASPEDHFQIGRELQGLRDQGILIIGSGNIVHNLRMVSFRETRGFDWNIEFDAYIRDALKEGRVNDVLNYRDKGDAARLAVPTTDHFDPLFYVLGASDGTDRLSVFNEAAVAGSLSMTSYLFE